MFRLLIATKNTHKTAEIRAILGGAWQIEDLNSHPAVSAPEETGTTFRENAEIKALAVSSLFDGPVLSDDSGLEVDALGGAPGVFSARYAGADASDAENRAKLIRELAARAERGGPFPARFRCVMALAKSGRVLGTFEGVVGGAVIDQQRGEGGFGYDSLFIPAGHTETFAELPAELKNGMSHRGRALESAARFLAARAAEKPPIM